MAIGTPTHLGHTTSGGGLPNTIPLTTAADVATGDLVNVCVYLPDATSTLASVSDTAGNTYVVDEAIRHPTDTSRYIAMASCRNAVAMATGGTITATLSSGIGAAIKEIIAATVPFDNDTALDKHSNNSGSSTTWSTGSTGTLTVADQIAFAYGWSLSSTANAPDAGWTELVDYANNSRRHVHVYQVVSATTALNAGGTWGNNEWLGIIATYREAPAAPASTQRIGLLGVGT